MTPHDVVSELFVRIEARDWRGAAELLARHVHIEFTRRQRGAPQYTR